MNLQAPLDAKLVKSVPPQETGGGNTYIFPVTFAQQRLWFLEQLSPGGNSYGILWPLRLTGPLDLAALERSVSEIVWRHEVLRTTFSVKDGEPVQVVRDAPVFQLPLTDITSEEEARRLIAEESRRPFDLETGPLLRGRLLRLSAADHVLVLATHHIIFDGSSRRILVRELSELYTAFRDGKPSPLPDLRLQYADYAVWQRKYLQGATLEKQISYWKHQLAGIPAAIQLPTDRPRPAIQTFAGASHNFTFSESLTARLNAFAKRREATLFMVLLAGFQALLSRYSGEEDIVVGTPIAGRNRLEVEDLIGLFANTLVLRTDLSGDPTAAELVARVRSTALAAYAHQELPFEKLVEELQPERSLSYNPVFQVLIGLLGTAGRAFELPDVEVKPFGGMGDSSKFDLGLFLAESPENISGRLEYNTDLFDAATIERLLGHYQMLLSSMVDRPEARLSGLQLLSPEEREQVVVGWNATTRNYPGPFCLHHLFAEQADLTPDAIACVFGHQRLSYRELNARSNQLAHYLLSSGAGPDVLIGICMSRGIEMLVGLLAILKSGSAYVPLDPNYPKDRLSAIIEDSRAPLVITQQSLANDLPGFAGRIISVDAKARELAAMPRENPATQVQPHHLAYVLFTSGSTGRPKGVAIEHRSAATFAHWAKEVFTPEELEGVLLSTSISFDLSVYEIFVTLHAGGKIIIAENALYLPTLPAREEVTLINTVPSAMAELVRSGGVPASVTSVNLAGEALPDALVEQIYANTQVKRVYNLYGPTEDTTYSTYTLVPRGRRVTIGRPIANTQAYILDAALNPLPAGVPGQLFLAGDGLAREYYGRPDLTRERFVSNPYGLPCARMYRTGDLCRWLPDGNIEYLGRMDHQVKLRGFRIELGEVETVLAQHRTVEECVVVAREERLVGYVVAAAGETVKPAELRAWVKERLPEYMVPAVIMELERFPYTLNGKVDRKSLPQPDSRPVDVERVYVGPRTATEEAIARVWAVMLNMDRVGVHDNFFELGGHSLLAVQVFARMEEVTGKKLPLDVLFRSPTIAEIASLMHHAGEVSREPSGTSIRPCRTEGSKPPIYAAHGIGGTVLTFRGVAAHLEPDQPLYCLEALGRDASWTCLEELAALYIKDLLAFQPEGPYHLIGSSFGGMVIFEIARQLHEQGHEVGFLGMLDSGNMGRRNLWTRKKRMSEKLHFFKRRTLMHLKRLFTRRLREWPRYSAGRVLALGRLMQATAWRFMFRFYKEPNKVPAPLLNMKRVYQSAGLSYIPKKYAGKITLFLAQDEHRENVRINQLGWAGWAEQGVEMIDVPGDHNTLLQEPNVQVLTQEMTKCLARYAAGSLACSGAGASTGGSRQ